MAESFHPTSYCSLYPKQRLFKVLLSSAYDEHIYPKCSLQYACKHSSSYRPDQVTPITTPVDREKCGLRKKNFTGTSDNCSSRTHAGSPPCSDSSSRPRTHQSKRTSPTPTNCHMMFDWDGKRDGSNGEGR